MKNKVFIFVFIFLIIFLFFGPFIVRAFSDLKGPILVSLFAKKETESTNWSKDIIMVSGENFDFLLVVKNNGVEPLKDVNLEIEIPKEILYNGYLTINGKTKKQKIKEPLDLGAFLPSEQKTIEFQLKSQNQNFKDEKREITAKVFAGSFASLDSVSVILKPYTFEGIKIERKTVLATAAFFAKQWYFWVIFVIVLIFFFLRIFLRLFSSPME